MCYSYIYAVNTPGMLFRNALAALATLFTLSFAQAQVLWFEDFEGEANGATSGTATGGTWTTTYGGAGTFSKQNPLGFNVFLVNDTDGEGVWNMAPVSIAATGRAIIETTVVGFLTGAGDYVRLYYRLDGGPEVLFFEQTGTVASFTLTGSAIVTGSTLEIVIRATTNGDAFGFDSYTFDDIRITAINTLYSRKSGNWNDATVGNGTWSAASLGGASCDCTPIATDYLIIGNSNTVDINVAATAGGVEVRNTGSLRYTVDNVDLNIDRGILQVDNGGSINRNGRANVQIDFDRGISSTFINNGTITTEAIEVTAANAQINISGSGSIVLTGDFSILADDIIVDNSLSGTFTIGDDLIFDQAADLFSDDAEFINRSSLTIASDILVGASDDDGNTFTNAAGATLNVVAINATDSDLDILNSGTITQTGDFLNVVGTANFNNLATGTWNWNFVQASFDAELNTALDCSAVGNTFVYGAAGGQNIAAVAYHHLTLSGSGTKVTTNNLDVNGNLLIAGTARLDPNTGNDNITLAGNWTVTSTNANPFDEGTEIVTFDGSTNSQSITTVLAGGETFSNLVLASTFPTAPQVTLNDNVGVSVGLTMTSGITNLNGNTLSILSNAAGSLVYTAGWVYGGPMLRAMANAGITVGAVRGHYPLGTATNYRPLFIGKPGGTGAGNTTVQHDGTLNTTSNVSFTDDLTITRRHNSFWTISSTVGGAAATWSLWAGGTGFGTIANTAHLRLSTSSGVVGTPGTNTGTTASPLVERLALSVALLNANNFHIASVDAVNSPLPIELLSFNATPDGSRVRVEWTTATELNNDYFTVERSVDGEKFSVAGNVPGAGNSFQQQSYQYLDEFPLTGVSYYRLRQTDIDGTFSFSPIKRVEISAAVAGLLVSPNPVEDGALKFRARGLRAGEEAEIRLIDLNGRNLGALMVQADAAGTIEGTVDVKGTGPGLYLLQMHAASFRSTEKVVIR